LPQNTKNTASANAQAQGYFISGFSLFPQRVYLTKIKL